MDFNLIGLIKAAVLNGTPLLFGTSGEILTEKSGNLNLGVEGLMYMGGAFGLLGAFVYDNAAGASASGAAAVIISLLCAFIAGCFGSLIFSFLKLIYGFINPFFEFLLNFCHKSLLLLHFLK